MVSQAINTIFTNNTEKTHTTTILESTRTRSTHCFNHFRLVAFILQTLRTTGSTVSFRYSNMTLSEVRESLIPGHTNEFVCTSACHLILLAVLFIQIRETVIRPLLPTNTDHRILVPVRAISTARIRHTTQTHARIPRSVSLVAIQIANLVMIVVLLDTHQDAVTYETTYSTLMGVVRRTTIRKRSLILVLITVDFFPPSVRIGFQRIPYFYYGLQLCSNPLARQCHSCRYTSTHLQELTSV